MGGYLKTWGDQVGMARFHMGDMRDTSNMGDQVGMARFHMGGHEGYLKTWVTR